MKSFVVNVVAKAPSAALQALHLTDLHSKGEKLVWQCSSKERPLWCSIDIPPYTELHTFTTIGKSLSGSVVTKGTLRGAPDSPEYTPPRRRGKAWLAMLLQRRPPWCSRLCTSHTSKAIGKSVLGNVVAKAPSAALQALDLRDLHSNGEKLVRQ
jgi:hypothetical protein